MIDVNEGIATPESMALRLNHARQELEHAADYRYLIVNAELESAITAFKSIIIAERLQHRRAADGTPLSLSW